MAKQDIRCRDSWKYAARPYQTKAGNTAIKAGEWVIQGTVGDVEYVKLAGNGSSDADVHVGLAVSADTVTASADGVVYVIDDPDAIFIAKPTTLANLASTVKLTKVTLDYGVSASGVFTLDEDDTTNGCFLILDYDTNRREVYFRVDPSFHLHG